MNYVRNSLRVWPLVIVCLSLLYSLPALAQVMVARDDEFGVGVIEPLVVDEPGVLDNDLLDEESATDFGAIAKDAQARSALVTSSRPS